MVAHAIAASDVLARNNLRRIESDPLLLFTIRSINKKLPASTPCGDRAVIVVLREDFCALTGKAGKPSTSK